MARRFLFLLLLLCLLPSSLLLPLRLLFADRVKGISTSLKKTSSLRPRRFSSFFFSCPLSPFFYGYRSFVWPSVPKELTEGHEQSRNEPELEGDPLISWLAASTSIFHRSNNRCNVPLKIHLVIGAVLVLSFFFLSSFSFLFFFFFSTVEMIAARLLV